MAIDKTAPPAPQPFTGVGVYLTSEIHSAKCASGRMSAEKLISAMASILDYQMAIIESNGGLIEQFVGDCIVAYWSPADPAMLVRAVRESAARISREKVTIDNLEFDLRITFCVAEMAGAYFGRPPGARFQIVGKARDRAARLLAFSPPGDWLITDVDTVALMPEPRRAEFTQTGSTSYSLQLS